MRIGIFDSGLGGLIILRSLRRQLRKFDYVYLGDTKNLPYGDRSQEQIYKLTKKSVEYLFKQNCQLVIVACNTASSQALRRLQQDYLPKSKFKDRKILGVIRPTVEGVAGFKRIGIIGTRRTIDSKSYIREIIKVSRKAMVIQKATPKLVPMIEANQFNGEILKEYLEPLKREKVDALILACTHYGLVKNAIRLNIKNAAIISQEEILPGKLKQYLNKHPEISNKLSKHANIKLLVTKLNPNYSKLARQWFAQVKLKQVRI